jgi:hypothetical protein
VQWKSNAINKWYFTLLVPNITSIEIKPIVTKLEHALKLCRCLDPYGEMDMNPIYLTCILEIKIIIRMNVNPWLNGKHKVCVQAPSAFLCFRSK